MNISSLTSLGGIWSYGNQTSFPQLQSAIRAGNVPQLLGVLSDSALDLSQPLPDGELPLHAAVRLEKIDLLPPLLKRGASLSQRDASGLTALDYAALKKDPRLIAALLPDGYAGKLEDLSQEVAQFVPANRASVEALRNRLKLLQANTKASTQEEGSSETARLIQAILVQDPAKVKALLAAKVSPVEKLEEPISPLHAAAYVGNMEILQALIATGASLYEKNRAGIAPADLLYADASERDPLKLKKAQLILALLGVGLILCDQLVEPRLSPNQAALWQGALLLLNLSTDFVLSYHSYLQLNPHSLFGKTLFWASALAATPLRIGLTRLPSVKVAWDLWRTSQVCYSALKGLQQAAMHSTYEGWRACQKAGLELLTVGTTLYQTRKSWTQAYNYISKTWGGSDPLESLPLAEKVAFALKNGGRIELAKGSDNKFSGNNGLYRIVTAQGKTIALFKPEDERYLGPNNRFADRRGANPSTEDIRFHNMPSYQQGKLSERQYLANQVYAGPIAQPPEGILTHLTSDQFYDASIEGERLQSKTGYLQEWIPNAKSLVDLKLEKEGRLVTTLEDYRFENDPILDKAPLDEFQKIGILDLLLYNEDRHAGNILVSYDSEGIPHLTPIDHDNLLPWKLEMSVSLLTHARAREPLSQASRKLIASFDEDKMASLVREKGLSEQAEVNVRLLSHLLKAFAAAGKTLADLYAFAAKTQPDQKTSPLWELVLKAKEGAHQTMTEGEKGQYRHYEHLQWLLWQKQPLGQSDADWLAHYLAEQREPIDQKLQTNFYGLFRQFLSNYLN